MNRNFSEIAPLLLFLPEFEIEGMKTLSFSVFSSSVFHGNLNFSLESLIGVEQPPDERAEAFGVGCLHVVDAACQQAQGERFSLKSKIIPLKCYANGLNVA